MGRLKNNRVIVLIMYLALTVLAVLSYFSTSLTVETLLPGLLLMWACFVVFWFGARPRAVVKATMPSQLMKLDSIILNDWRIICLMAINAVVFSIAIARYYTGHTPSDVINGLFGDVSLYATYQRYFQLHDLGTMTAAKYPYIAMNFLLNFITVYLYIGILLLYHGKMRWFHYLALIVCGVMYNYYGIARGTNFELFLFAFLNIYILMRKLITGRVRSVNTKKRTHYKYFTLTFIFLSFALIGFFVMSARRGHVFTGNYYLSYEVYYDSGKALSKAWPFAGYLVARLAHYFTWGIYYSSVFLTKIVFMNAQSFFSGLLPSGLSNAVPIFNQIAAIIDPSTNWMPDVVSFWDWLGLLGLCLFIYSLSIITKRLNNHEDTTSHIALYLVCLQMFSLPIGNFIVILSANKLIVVAVIILLLVDLLSSRSKFKLVKD